ncbi:MAG: aminotransferase class I/II-fold pyridoxal phosphate-dependent enzyme [Methylobacillus sp.]|nr:aminotransferase class I/II-fold pyridoxal phosphate-dependent enzyme [Methylobacillus sp.]
MQEKTTTDLSTTCIHSGDLKDSHGAVHMPLYDATTFRFSSTEQLLEVIDGKRAGYLYTRYGMNPTIISLEEKIAAIDGAEAALAFGAGMAALSALFLACGTHGIACVGDVYGGTLELLDRQLPGLGIKTHHVSPQKLETLETVLSGGVKLVFFETPSNPLLEVIDIRKVTDIAHRHGALAAIDNTFASPVNQRPLELGVDFTMQSATKYLGGHSSVTGGVISAKAALLERIKPWRKNLGQMISPDQAHRLASQLGTLSLRVEKQNANAFAIAKFLAVHPKVSRVFYPGLPSHPNHEVAKRQMSGFGGMVTFDYKGSSADSTRVIEKLKIFSLAPSLGGVESLVTQPHTTSHHDLSAAERAEIGITDTMARLSVGIENETDLIADLEQALDS